nr:hypothetical protein [Tanacetum cinerariifolium]
MCCAKVSAMCCAKVSAMCQKIAKGNAIKTKRLWDAVINYFTNETGSTRGYDSVVCKWKNIVRPRIGRFCAIINNIEHNYENGSVQGGFNLNNEAVESEEETQEERPIGRDRAKKKSSASSCEGSSFVDLVANKFFNCKSAKWGKTKEQQDSYIQLKNRELDIQEVARREAADLKRKKLEIQRRTLELAQKKRTKTSYYILQ